MILDSVLKGKKKNIFCFVTGNVNNIIFANDSFWNEGHFLG